MYQPSHFTESDPARIATLMAAYNFATLVSVRDGLPLANHLPLLFAPGEGPRGTLYGHLARGNPHAAFAPAEQVLAIFSGPHAYVSPSWYATPGVPTWNFCAVHASGRVRIITEAGPKAALMRALTERHDPPVAVDDGPQLAADAWERMLGGIVAFAIEVDNLEAKFKLSQNRSLEDRQRVIAQLGQDEHPDAQALAGLMLEDLLRHATAGGRQPPDGG
jgi:transcriptional regulator